MAVSARVRTDTNYIKPYPYNASAKTYLSSAFNSISITSKILPDSLGNTTITHEYQPDLKLVIGIGGSYENLALSVGLGLGLAENKLTYAFDFQTGYFGKRFVGDFYLLNYNGYYLTTTDDEGNKKRVFDPNISSLRIGAFGEYIFNAEKFSYRSSFNCSEKQVKSAGGFLLGLGLFYSVFNYDSLLDKSENIRQTIENYQIGPSVGYAYTFVFKNDFFTTLGASIGSNIDFCSTNGSNKFDNIQFQPYIQGRLALGYHKEDWSILCTTLSRGMRVVNKNDLSSIVFNDFGIKVSFFKRFNYEHRMLSKVSSLFDF